MRGIDSEPGHKFMQVLDKTTLKRVRRFAKKRGVTLQEMIRCVIVPEWLMLERLRESNRKTLKNGKPKKL